MASKTRKQLVISSEKHMQQLLEFDNPTRFANEIMFAKHNLKELQIKTWLLSLAALAKNQPITDDTVYEFKMVEIGEQLNINKKSGWRTIIRDTIMGIAHQSANILKRNSINEDKVNWIIIPFYDYVDYNEFEDIVILSINKKLLPYLQDFTDRYTEIDIKEMIAVRGIMQIRTLMIVKEFISENRFAIPINEFKERLDVAPNAYPQFRDFQKRVLKPAEKEIREHTSMKNFSFSHDGKGRNPATTIFLNVNEKKNTGKKEQSKPKKKLTLFEKIDALDFEQQKLIDELMYCGVSPQETCYNIVTEYSVDVIKSNVEYFKEKQKTRAKEHKEAITAGYLITCIKKDYAKPNREALLRQADTNEKIQNDMVSTDIKLEDAYKQCKATASMIIKKGDMDKILDIFEMASLTMENMASNMGIAFDLDDCRVKIQKRDLRNKETMFFREQLAQRIMNGLVDVNDVLGK